MPVAGKTGFTHLPPEQTGIFFTNELDEWKGEANRVLSNGSGLAAGDFDNDGLPDLYFCSLQGRNALYKNLGGGDVQERDRAVRDRLSGPELSRRGFRRRERRRLA